MRITPILSTIALLLSTALPALSTPCSKGKYFDKVLTIIFENEDAVSAFSDPYFADLATKGYALTNMHGTTHPSQPNYISMVGGDVLGVTANGNVNLAQTNLIDLLESKRISWKAYMEDMTAPCSTSTSSPSGLYVRKHNPFISFTNISRNATRCAKIVPATQFTADINANRIPEYMFYAPNMQNDGHDTSVGYAGNWLKGFLEGKLGTTAFENTLIFITFDESDTVDPNLIYGVLLGAGIPGTGLTDATRYDHYSWLATIEDNFSLGSLNRKDATAPKFPLVAGGCGGAWSVTTTVLQPRRPF
ncbi:phosphoesterase family-domain-containing protein [Chytridium lagenaria]|nr:phosphoesterase family-domain-containing protein [Chytridium lagenaria]